MSRSRSLFGPLRFALTQALGQAGADQRNDLRGEQTAEDWVAKDLDHRSIPEDAYGRGRRRRVWHLPSACVPLRYDRNHASSPKD